MDQKCHQRTATDTRVCVSRLDLGQVPCGMVKEWVSSLLGRGQTHRESSSWWAEAKSDLSEEIFWDVCGVEFSDSVLLQPLQRLRVGSRFAGLLQCKHASVNFSYRNTAPGNIERLNNEEPSPLTAAEGQGAPSTLGSLKSVDMSCGHPFGDPGPLADHDMPQIPKSRGASW